MNERLLSLYDENILYCLLNNAKQYSDLFDKRINRYNKDTKLVDLINIDALESFIIKCKCNRKYTSLIDKYTSFLFDRFKKNPYVIYDSILFSDKYVRLFFDYKQTYEINAFKKKIHFRIDNSFKRKDKMLSDYHLKMAINEIGNKNETELLSNTYEYLLNNIKYNNNYLAYEFITKYTAYLASRELNIDKYNVYLTNYDLYDDKILDCSGKSYTKQGIVLLDRGRFIKPEKLIYLIQTVGHEMKHVYQYNSFENKEISKKSFDWALYYIFSNYLDDEYEKNYDNLEIENDANNYGWDLTLRIFTRYVEDNAKDAKYAKRRKDQEVLKNLVNLKYNRNNTDCMDAVSYNVSNLDKIVEKNPSLLSKFNLLGYIYHNNGKRASFTDMVHYENRLLLRESNKYKSIKDIYKQFYLYDIKGGININLYEYTNTRKLQILNKLVDLCISELISIKEIKDLSNRCGEDYKYRTNTIFRLKLGIVSKITKYLNENSYIILNLNNKLLNTKINKLLVLINDLDVSINNNFINNLFYKKNTYDIHINGYKLRKVLS